MRHVGVRLSARACLPLQPPVPGPTVYQRPSALGGAHSARGPPVGEPLPLKLLFTAPDGPAWPPSGVLGQNQGHCHTHHSTEPEAGVFGWSPGCCHRATPTHQLTMAASGTPTSPACSALMCFLCSMVLEKVLSQELHCSDENLEDRWF